MGFGMIRLKKRTYEEDKMDYNNSQNPYEQNSGTDPYGQNSGTSPYGQSSGTSPYSQGQNPYGQAGNCLLYTSDAADE